ncbi:MAG: plasmid mobilization relaxosome protein MobC [Proteobacteria bacterium]|nr:plasmid mobilization relaxosome protein MobC [Pseudomonadota bacterium]
MTEQPSQPSKKRRLGRKRRENVTGGRQHSHRVKVTPEEEAELVRRAELERVSVPRLMVEAALADERGETSSQRRSKMVMLFQLRRSVAGLARNVNQIAAYANATDEFPMQAYELMPQLRSTCVRIDAAIDELSNG